LTLFGVDLYFASTAVAGAAGHAGLGEFLARPANWRVLADIVLIGLFGGFYIVPLYALIQTRSEKSHQSRVIAANNILNALFMVGSAGISLLLFSFGLSIPQLFLATALFNAVVAIYIYRLVPEFLLRFIVWILVHSIYRLDIRNIDRVPDEGAALIICNHVSFVDALIIAAGCRRPIRFVMDHHIFRWPIMSFVFRESRAIPIASAREDPALMEKAFDEISSALAAGELVGIFPEGKVTQTGDMNVFRPGISRILARNPVPVIPMALRGLWGSFFSRAHGAAMSKPWKARPFMKIALAVGAPVDAGHADPSRMQEIVAGLRGDAR
jgi:1-acyl-sn-glycerol-3-phosphate acyltransferase